MTYDLKNLPAQIEALLFTSGASLQLEAIARALNVDVNAVKSAASELDDHLSEENRGLRIVWHEDRLQLITAPEAADAIARHMKDRLRDDISPAASETLAIIAYRGPITRAGIEAIRGVNTTFTLRLLSMRGLVEKGKNSDDSRSPLYRISEQFLSHLGLFRIEDLPDYESLSCDYRVTAVEEGSV